MTRIGIIGAGRVGKALGQLATDGGYEVRFASRDDRGNGLAAIRLAEFADLLVLAVPYAALAEALPPLCSALAGKIVVDATNPVAADWSPLVLEGGLSGAEIVAGSLPGARVVKAFNTVFADNMQAERLTRGDRRISTFIAADDTDAAALVAGMAAAMGFDPVVTGALAHARHLEAIAHLNIALLARNAMNTRAAFLYDNGEA